MVLSGCSNFQPRRGMGRCPTAELVEECSLAKHHVHQMRSRLQIIFSKPPPLIYSVNGFCSEKQRAVWYGGLGNSWYPSQHPRRTPRRWLLSRGSTYPRRSPSTQPLDANPLPSTHQDDTAATLPLDVYPSTYPRRTLDVPLYP